MKQIKQAKFLKGCTGSSNFPWHPDYELDLDAIGAEVLGGWDKGAMFLYLFRRFGYPMHGWDEYKEAFGYTLTTPMKDVYLYVNQSGFAYRVHRELQEKLIAEARSPRNAWRERCDRWTKETHGVTAFTIFDWQETTEQLEVLLAWLRKTCLSPDDPGYGDPEEVVMTYYKDVVSQSIQPFWDECEKQAQHYRMLYRGIEETPDSEASIDPGGLRDRVVNALRAAIQDLLRPVGIRDWQINCLGAVSDQDARHVLKPSHMVGYGIKTDVFLPKQVDSYFEAMQSFRRLGKGNVVKGMTIALAAANSTISAHTEAG